MSVRVGRSPRRAEWLRATGTVRYDSGAPGVEEVWFEVPAEHESALSPGGDAWVAALAPAAVAIGEPLVLRVPTDPHLRDGAAEASRAWRSWFPGLRELRIQSGGDLDRPVGTRTASFFSGGVDSFFTALRHDAGEGTPSTVRIDDLVLVHGFDVALDNQPAFDTVASSLARAADVLGKRLVTVATNLRETRFAAADWSRMAHGAALAAVAHLLGAAYHTVLIGSSAGYRDLRPWGSHPLTDPMFSSSRTSVLHDGAAFMRVEKTEYVARSPVALAHLRVCWKSETGGNCGGCTGCYRTMLALDALGALDRCATFDRRDLDLERAGRIFCRHDFDIRQFGYVLDLARRAGRDDIARAVERSLRESERMRARVASLRRMRDAKVLWRWAPEWERRLLRGWLD